MLRLLIKSRTFLIYRNGDGYGFVFRWWHPVSWIALPIMFVASVYAFGYYSVVEYPHELGIGIDPWFEKNPDQLHWISVKEYLEETK